MPRFTFFHTMRLSGDQDISNEIFKKNQDFFQFFLHAGTVEENT